MKKLLSVFLAVCLAVVCMCGFVACDNIDAPTNKPEIGDNNNNNGDPTDDDKKPNDDNGDKKPTYSDVYYAYDVETDEYEDADFIAISSTAAAWHGVDISLGELDFDGNVRFDGNDFTITVNGKFSAQDTCIMTYRGKKESDGVLRVDSTVITKYSTLVPQPSVTTDVTVRYYCKKGSKPKNPVLPNEPNEPDDRVDGTFYLYDTKADDYVESEYIVISGGDCKIITEADGMILTYTGTFTKTGDEFVIDCSLNFFEGVTMRTVDKGKVKNSGVLHVTYSEQAGSADGGTADTSVFYCKKGSLPDYSVDITFDFNGGTLNGKESVVVKSNTDGTLVYPDTPVKDGMGLICYTAPHSNTWYTPDSIYHKEDTFAEPTTLTAKWGEMLTLDFDVDSDEYELAQPERATTYFPDGGLFKDLPTVRPKVKNPKERFMGWYVQKFDYPTQIQPQLFMSLNIYKGNNGRVRVFARWYDEEAVNRYNARLTTDAYENGKLYIHYIPDYYKENWGSTGGASKECFVYREKDGKKDETSRYDITQFRGDIVGSTYSVDIANKFWHDYYDDDGKFHRDYVSFDDCNLYVELRQTDGSYITYYIKQSDLDRSAPNHIFVHEGASTYTRTW